LPLVVTGGGDGDERIFVFYEYRALDRFVTRREMRKFCAISMRAKLTPEVRGHLRMGRSQRRPETVLLSSGMFANINSCVLMALQSPR
jgi:hypothetical protein